MNKTLFAIHVLVLASVMTYTGGLFTHQTHERPESITIRFTTVPPRGGGPDKRMTIAGVISGIDVKKCDCRMVLYSEPGDKRLYVQPWADAPFTDLKNNTFENSIHLGDYYHALLVSASYRPQATLIEPPTVGGDVLAVARVEAKREEVEDR
jgi:hypothetical protein